MDNIKPKKQPDRTEEEKTRITGAVIGGAILGGSLGGPAVAVIGGIIGAIFAKHVNDTKRKEDKNG